MVDRQPEGVLTARTTDPLALRMRFPRLSVYMLDAENKDFALNPVARELSDMELNKPLFLTHNCFACYVVATHLASERFENIYSRQRYRDAETPTPSCVAGIPTRVV